VSQIFLNSSHVRLHETKVEVSRLISPLGDETETPSVSKHQIGEYKTRANCGPAIGHEGELSIPVSRGRTQWADYVPQGWEN
jgi:hypothetical protein